MDKRGGEGRPLHQPPGTLTAYRRHSRSARESAEPWPFSQSPTAMLAADTFGGTPSGAVFGCLESWLLD